MVLPTMSSYNIYNVVDYSEFQADWNLPGTYHICMIYTTKCQFLGVFFEC